MQTFQGREPFTDPQNIENDLIDCDIFLNDGIIQSSGASTVIKIENGEDQNFTKW